MLMRNYTFPGPRPSPRALDIPAPERSLGEQLLAEIEAFLRVNPHITQHGFGRLAANNKLLVMRLQEGLNPEPITQRRVRQFIAEYSR